MATTTELEQTPTLVPPLNGRKPAPKNNKVRSAPPIPPAVEPEITEVAAEETKGGNDIWAEVASIEDWSHRFAYLYRLGPTIDRRSGGRQMNIEKFARPFDVDDIMRKHGSGVYRIDLFKINETNGRYVRYRQERFDIVNMDYPPNVPPGDWTNEPENAVWQWAVPKIQAAAAANNGGGMYPPGFNLKEVYDSAFQMAKQMTPPPKDDSALAGLVTKLIDVSLNRPEPKADNSMTLVIELLRADLKEAREEMRELRKVQNAPPPAQKGIIEQVKELRPVLSEFVDLFEQKTGNQPWWAGPLEKLMDGVGEAIPTVVEMMKTGQQQQQNRQPAAQWNPPTTGIPAPQTSTAAPPPPTGPPPPATTTAANPEQPDLNEEQKRYLATTQRWGGFILVIAPQMVEHFKTENGAEFRDWVCRMHGLLRYSDMCRELGPDYLLAMIAQHPGISADMMPVEVREQFVQEFFQVDEEDDEEEEVPGDGVIDLGGPDAA
jgi:hypothetical protein